MKTNIRLLLSTAILALVACSPLIYGKLESPQVAVTQSFTNLPGAVDLSKASLIGEQNFSVGDITVDETTQDSSLTLNTVTMTVIRVTAGAPDFDGVQDATFNVVKAGFPTPVASYKKGLAGTLSADKKTITFAPTANMNLLKFLNGKSYTVSVTGAGTSPGAAGPSWDVDVTIDLHVVAQKNIL